jgi:hypothetical protein
VNTGWDILSVSLFQNEMRDKVTGLFSKQKKSAFTHIVIFALSKNVSIVKKIIISFSTAAMNAKHVLNLKMHKNVKKYWHISNAEAP